MGAKAAGQIVAGKTGTTNDSYDAWFMGFTRGPRHRRVGRPRQEGTTARRQRAGRPHGAAHLGRLHQPRARRLHEEPPAKIVHGDFDPPFGVVRVAIDPDTGLLARPGGRAVDEYYRAGTEPTEVAPDKAKLNPDELDQFQADTPL